MIELIPETYLSPLDVLAIFGQTAPLHVDLGCGDGTFLCELAQRMPDRDFLGIDKLAGRVAKTIRKAATLKNVRVLNVEISYAVRYLLPEESVEAFYLFFPDPWPKRRHHRRRLVTAEFVDSIHRALQPNGVLHIATDQADYFEHIHRIARNHSGLAVVDLNDACHAGARRGDQRRVDLPSTKFQRRFMEMGAPIYRLSLRKTSPVK